MEYNMNVNTKWIQLGSLLCLSHMKKKGIFHGHENFENAPVFF